MYNTTPNNLLLFGVHQVIGKSDIVRQTATNLNIELVDIRASQMDPVDLLGIPMVDPTTRTTVWATPAFLPTDGKGILFLDEMNSAAPSDVSPSFIRSVKGAMLHQSPDKYASHFVQVEKTNITHNEVNNKQTYVEL